MKESKSGVPVNEKYAGIYVKDEQLAIVPKIIAQRLKKAGYSNPTRYYYDNDVDDLFNTPFCNLNAVENFVSAPFLYEVKEWLSKLGVIINVYSKTERKDKGNGKYEYVATSEWYRTIYTKVNGVLVQYKRPINTFVSENDALSIAIREGVNFLLKDSNSPLK